MKDPTIVRYEVTVQAKLERKASKVLNNLENTMIKMYGKDVLEHFPWSLEQRTEDTENSNYKPLYRPIVINDDTDTNLELLIAREKEEDQYTKIIVEGLELLNEEYETSTEVVPKAMLIHTGNSDTSMSGISMASKNTTGSVHWETGVEGKERTVESIRKSE